MRILTPLIGEFDVTPGRSGAVVSANFDVTPVWRVRLPGVSEGLGVEASAGILRLPSRVANRFRSACRSVSV